MFTSIKKHQIENVSANYDGDSIGKNHIKISYKSATKPQKNKFEQKTNRNNRIMKIKMVKVHFPS